jgi:hypothetical protein
MTDFIGNDPSSQSVVVSASSPAESTSHDVFAIMLGLQTQIAPPAQSESPSHDFFGVRLHQCAFVFPPPPPQGFGEIVPNSDTIRGGKLVAVATAAPLLDTTQDQPFFSLGLPDPTAWVPVVVNSGTVTPTAKGLVIDTGLASGSSAGMVSEKAYANFDLMLDVELQAPVPGTLGLFDLVSLEATSAAGAVARVMLRLGVGSRPGAVVAWGDTQVPGQPVIIGGTAILASAAGVLTLRVVRNGVRIFGFVGQRDSTGAFTELAKVIDSRTFVPDSGAVRFAARNNTPGGRARTRVSNLTFRSHTTISSRLLDNKDDLSQRRIFGFVPAASLPEIGLRDVVIFGLFGQIVLTNGFLYTLPPEKTVGVTSASSLATVIDPALRDGTS